MILLDVAPIWVPYAFIAGGFIIIGGAVFGIVYIAAKLIKKAISKNREE